MANSRYQYVKEFERENVLLPETHIVIRVDGKGFHKFSERYDFNKPNDDKALKVMNLAALEVMKKIPDVLLAYGDSDEYSFLLRKSCEMFERREFKLITTFSSMITAYYQYYWGQVCPDKPLDPQRLPMFDARAVVYPTDATLRDYFSWRQVDCHINNLYNTTFWALVTGGMTPQEAENRLMGTVSADKNEILFSQFGINYNNEPEIYKKGTIYVRDIEEKPVSEPSSELSKGQLNRLQKRLRKSEIKELHCDIIQAQFWEARPWLFS